MTPELVYDDKHLEERAVEKDSEDDKKDQEPEEENGDTDVGVVKMGERGVAEVIAWASDWVEEIMWSRR